MEKRCRPVGVYRSDLEVKHLNHMSVTKCTIPFRWNSLPAGEMLDRVDSICVQDVGNAHFEFRKVVSNVSLFSVDKCFTGKISQKMDGGGCCHPSRRN